MTVKTALAALKRAGSKKQRDGYARYGIVAEKAFGVPMAAILEIAKDSGRDHALAAGLWKTGWYEARLLAALVGDPAKITPAQMDAWCREFDNWGVCDTACFNLFDKSPHAWRMVDRWSRRKPEFEKRASYALIASLAGHDKSSTDEDFERRLPLISRGASDERNFVKKAVSWALRGMGHRNAKLHAACVELATRTLEVGPPR